MCGLCITHRLFFMGTWLCLTLHLPCSCCMTWACERVLLWWWNTSWKWVLTNNMTSAGLSPAQLLLLLLVPFSLNQFAASLNLSFSVAWIVVEFRWVKHVQGVAAFFLLGGWWKSFWKCLAKCLTLVFPGSRLNLMYSQAKTNWTLLNDLWLCCSWHL